MVGLIIVAIALAASFFAALGFAVGYNTVERRIYGGLVGMTLALGLFFVFVFMAKDQNKAMTERYNNGICTVCGGDYEFSGATRSNTSQYYFYTCEDCGHTIEVNKIMK